jgi:hypothetical protein
VIDLRGCLFGAGVVGVVYRHSSKLSDKAMRRVLLSDFKE